METIPICCFLLMIGIFAGPWRERFLLASVCWGVSVLFVTELLSAWHGLDRMGLAAAWSVMLIVLGVRCWIVKPRFLRHSLRLNLGNAVIVTSVSGILLVTAVIAYYAAPNNWDSMTYHLARVAHWAQDKTVAMYPTSNLRQIYYPPWSSYAITQFYILAGSDRWVNFIQWFSSLGSVLGVSLIVVRLKGKTQTQVLAGAIVATIPMGILQSTSTQNDYVLAFWLVCFVYFGLGLLQEGRWLYSLAAAASLGLMGLVKGTGYVYGLPFLIWVAVGGIKNHGRKFLIHIAAILLIAVLLNSSYYFRNFSLSGSIVPPSESANIIGKQLDLKVMTANFVLNLGLHAATVWDGPNRWVEMGVDRAHHWLGIEQGDERVCMARGITFKILSSSFRYHEDYAGNFIHTLLILFCLPASLFLGSLISKDCRYYALALLGAVLFFVMVIKWSPYHSRYHLPIFVLFAPFLAVVLSSCFRPGWLVAIAMTLMVASIPWLVSNKSRPLLGPMNVFTTPRMDQYFFNSPGDISYVYALLAAAQVDCKQIGLVFGGDTWEYPLNAISKWENRGDIRFEHIFVNNDSAKLPYPLGAFDPCVLIKKGDESPDVLTWQGHFFREIGHKGAVFTYLRVD